jgi:hypothetical protein
MPNICLTIERHYDGTIEYRDHAHYGDDGTCEMTIATLIHHLDMGHRRCAYSYIDDLEVGETIHIRTEVNCPLADPITESALEVLWEIDPHAKSEPTEYELWGRWDSPEEDR